MLIIKEPMRLDEFKFEHYFWLNWPIMFRKHYMDVVSGTITTVTVNGDNGKIKIDGNITLEILEDFYDMQAAGIRQLRPTKVGRLRVPIRQYQQPQFT